MRDYIEEPRTPEEFVNHLISHHGHQMTGEFLVYSVTHPWAAWPTHEHLHDSTLFNPNNDHDHESILFNDRRK